MSASRRWTISYQSVGDHNARIVSGPDVDAEVEVMPVAEHERLMANRWTCVRTCGDTPEEEGGVCKGLPR